MMQSAYLRERNDFALSMVVVLHEAAANSFPTIDALVISILHDKYFIRNEGIMQKGPSSLSAKGRSAALLK